MFTSSPLTFKLPTSDPSVTRPSRVITYLLLFFSYTISFASAKDAPENVSTCNPEELPELSTSDPSAEFAVALTPFDALKQNYHVITNTDDFFSVKVFLLGERHDDINHHQFKVDFVNNWWKPRDRVLIEGIANTTTFFCEDLCITSKNRMSLLKANDPDCKAQSGFMPNISCQGWENPKLLEAAIQVAIQTAHQKSHHQFRVYDENHEESEEGYRQAKLYEEKYGEIEEKFTAWQQLLDNYLKNLKLILPSIENQQTMNRGISIRIIEEFQVQVRALRISLKEIHTEHTVDFTFIDETEKAIEDYKKDKTAPVKNIRDFLTKPYLKFLFIQSILKGEKSKHDFLFKALFKGSEEQYDKTVIEDRNQFFISTYLNSNLVFFKSPNKQIGSMGTRHLVPDDTNPHRKITSKDPQFKLHEALKEIPHVIAIPKKFA